MSIRLGEVQSPLRNLRLPLIPVASRTVLRENDNDNDNTGTGDSAGAGKAGEDERSGRGEMAMGLMGRAPGRGRSLVQGPERMEGG